MLAFLLNFSVFPIRQFIENYIIPTNFKHEWYTLSTLYKCKEYRIVLYEAAPADQFLLEVRSLIPYNEKYVESWDTTKLSYTNIIIETLPNKRVHIDWWM